MAKQETQNKTEVFYNTIEPSGTGKIAGKAYSWHNYKCETSQPEVINFMKDSNGWMTEKEWNEYTRYYSIDSPRAVFRPNGKARKWCKYYMYMTKDKDEIKWLDNNRRFVTEKQWDKRLKESTLKAHAHNQD